MPIRIVLSGATGKMGSSIIKAAKDNASFNIICKLSNANANQKIVYNDIDLWIDFSSVRSCLKYLQICKKHKIPMVIGTTGFSKPQYQKIESVAQNIPILFSPNMSLGANICQWLLVNLSKLWHKGNTKVNIKETHHKEKLDAPSGTALKMASLVKQHFSKEIEINFISKRVGKVKGKHEIIFSNPEEEIIIKHNVKSRRVFANGALMAAQWLVEQQKNAGIYSMFDMFNFNI